MYHIARSAHQRLQTQPQRSRPRRAAHSGDRVRLEVRDWGIGFTPPVSSKEVHGLRGMTERARIAGGKCAVRRASDRGTEVIVDLPYQARNQEVSVG